MPLLETKGAGSARGFGFAGGRAAPVFVEDVFSTWLYTGTDAAQTIVNGIDLAGRGGLVWIKNRSGTVNGHNLWDTARGTSNFLEANTAAASAVQAFSTFNSTGFTWSQFSNASFFNAVNQPYVSWTFRRQARFFDLQTWSGASNQKISHNLGVVPGCIMIKKIGNTVQQLLEVFNWLVCGSYRFGKRQYKFIG